MIGYLDQNKWIELARIVHGKDRSAHSQAVLRAINAGSESGCMLPLSGVHYMETARIANVRRRARLGAVMWKFSKGYTIAAYSTIVEHELEAALAKHFAHVKPHPFNFVGRGIAHAFGRAATAVMPGRVNDAMEEAMLTGCAGRAIDPLSFKGHTQRDNFRSHLEKLQKTKHELPKHKWEDWLYAISVVDILEPLSRVMSRHNLDKRDIEPLGAPFLTALVNDMPTRRVDVHLHRQVLRNSSYRPRKTDLEDWAGLAIASSYCDVVVCEKHMADMLKRDGFRARARIETSLPALFRTIRAA